MASPLALQRQALLKKQSKSVGAKSTLAPSTNSLHLLLVELENDIKQLKSFNRIDEKVAHKRDVLVPKYRESVKCYLEGEETFDNPLLAQMVIWLFDIEDLETAITWCNQAIERGLDTPERFKRDFATFCADEVLAWSEKMASQGQSIEPYFSQVLEKVRDEWSINEKPTAKWLKFAGLNLLRDENGQAKASSVGDVETLLKAKAYLEEAHNQYINVGVKTMIDKIDQRISALETGKNL